MRIVAGTTQAGAPDPLQKVALTREEWDLVWALRDVPAGALKERLQHLLQDIVTFVNHPTCAESQADGVPCASLDRECAQCRRVEAGLALLADTLQYR